MAEENELREAGDQFGSRIDGLLDETGVASRVSGYFDAEGPYAASSFEEGENPPTTLCSDDFLAVGFLDVPIPARAYRRIRAKGPQIEALLRAIPTDVDIWDMRHGDGTYVPANELWELLDRIPDMGPTRVSKLMARKRPRLVPIWDRRVDDFFGNPYWTWTPLSIALRDEGRRHRLSALRSAAAAPKETSLLRILDVAIWSSTREGLSPKEDALREGGTLARRCPAAPRRPLPGVRRHRLHLALFSAIPPCGPACPGWRAPPDSAVGSRSRTVGREPTQ